MLALVRPTLEYESEVWEANKSQAAALESVMLGGAKRMLGCSSRTCNEAVRGDMGLDTLQGRRDRKLWQHPKKLFTQEWTFKPRRGKQRKCWNRVVNDLFSTLGLDKAEWLQDIQSGECSLKVFLSIVGESIEERETKEV